MIKISELRAFLRDFGNQKIGKTPEQFVQFIEDEQAKQKKGGVVPIEERLQRRRLSEINERIERERMLNPDEDFNNL